MSDEAAARSDGVRMAILSSRMESIARKMQNTLFRTARSGVLNTAHDFSCVVLTADCRLLAAAESLPIHVMIGPDLMQTFQQICHGSTQIHKISNPPGRSDQIQGILQVFQGSGLLTQFVMH